MKSVLITGGTGYIGSILAEYLYSCGDYKVVITKRKGSNSLSKLLINYEVRNMDLLKPTSIKDICKGIDIVIHTATFDERLAKQYPKEILIANGYGTRQLLEDASNNDVERFIYLSTFHVYGRDQGYIDENSLVNPVSDYALTHYVGEMYCNQFSKLKGLKNIIIRITNGYGAPAIAEIDKWYLVLNNFCKSAMEDKKIVLKSTGTQLRDFVAIRDIVKAVEILISFKMNNEETEVFNISSQESITIRSLAKNVARIYRSRYGDSIELNIPDITKKDKNKESSLFVDSSKMRALEWEASINIEEEINRIFDLLEKSRSDA